MEPRLKIIWEGATPGIQSGRLSLGEFVKSLELLLTAVRRIAGNITRNAISGEEKPAVTGRLSDLAKRVDLQIKNIERSSVGIEAVCTMLPSGEKQLEMMPLLEYLTFQTSKELLNSIQLESEGKPYNSFVRKYLQALPQGISQQYDLYRNGDLVKTLEIGKLDLVDDFLGIPSLDEITAGAIVAVGFSPGSSYVVIKEEDRQVQLQATEEQVENALKLRNKSVFAIFVSGKPNRLLWLLPEGEKMPIPPSDKQIQLLIERWDGVLRRLAE